MTLGAEKDWREEFGLDLADANLFFADPSELARRGSASSQAHVLRHAFKLLDLDGILCTDHAPLVYFKKVRRIDADAAADLHHRFWNHGGAPILVLISPDEVHVYSGLVQPVARGDLTGRIPALVETLNRTSSALREFLPAVESGAFFRIHHPQFDPANRVDRALLDNLQQTRQILIEAADAGRDTRVLDSLLCRLVFACYLFDRGVIGPSYLQAIGFAEGSHLRDVLGLPKTRAKQLLYALFKKLGEDFNGDLFSTNLATEARQIPVAQMETLSEFFHATRVQDGQRSFWPYNFAAIPVEVISAIYERFLQTSDRTDGAFYTPRFLAEAVLDVALAPMTSLLGRRYLDPSCGSGIFLVGLFNRMAEEWKRSNPTVRSNDRRARELRSILCNSLYGIDVNPTACRITAFSLYLAYLDQLSPRDIQELQEKGHKLPRLVHYRDDSAEIVEGNIWCGDFFDESAPYPPDVDLVIGNPPWGSTASAGTPAALWCATPDRGCPIPDKQMSAAFIWKAARHVRPDGRISLVLPHGTLFNHSSSALNFQRAFFEHHAVDHVLNLTDYRFFLFADAIHPAVVLTYKGIPPDSPNQSIEYWAPKADWLVMRAQIISVAPEDRSRLTSGEVLADLIGPDAPQIWKQRFWTTARDRRLIERLSLYSRLRDTVRQSREKTTAKRWLIAEGFQPVGKSDDADAAVTIRLPSRYFVKARSPRLQLFLLHHDCAQLEGMEQAVRAKSNKVTEIFKRPHVLVTKGFSAAFADFDVSFRHAVRGISGPEEDRNLLAFLAAYLSSSLARYFAFHTSSNWGIYRPEVQVEELLRLPFPLPAELPNPVRALAIVNEVAEMVTRAAAKSEKLFVDREEVVRETQHSIEVLIDEYFDVVTQERVLVDDTNATIIPSVQPRPNQIVETMQQSGDREHCEYLTQLTTTLNQWARRGPYRVHGFTIASSNLGIGIAVLEKALSGTAAPAVPPDATGLMEAFDSLRKAAAQHLNTFELIRGAKVFDGDRLYVVKPIGRRFWTRTAALNDADEIAGTILMSTAQRPA